MDQILPPELNDFEFEALRLIAAHPATRRIQSRFKEIGYGWRLCDLEHQCGQVSSVSVLGVAAVTLARYLNAP